MVSSRSAILIELLKGESYIRKLLKRIQDSSEGSITVSPANASSMLKRMASEGLLLFREERQAPGHGGKSRLWYKLTDEGYAQAHIARNTILKMVLAYDGGILPSMWPTDEKILQGCSQIVCPHCGNNHESDTDEGGVMSCERCQKSFAWDRVVTYTSTG